uniref:Large ribosomal subunit protein bL12 C-terminal domain-containing protein n=1 Tax=Araucaria cunninghamii TaxID=56994 RepID=A0A0D6R4I8_ARACU
MRPQLWQRLVGQTACRMKSAIYFSTEVQPRKKYKLPLCYNPYRPRPPPSEKIVKLAEEIASLPPEERRQIAPCLRERLRAPRIQMISGEVAAAISQTGSASTGASAGEEKKAEKTVFSVKLEKFDGASKIKVIKEVRAFTDLGLKEAKELVEKVPVVLKQGLTKEEANGVIEKIKAAGGVAVME